MAAIIFSALQVAWSACVTSESRTTTPPLATDRSRAPYAGSQALRDRLQQLVTNGVSERVIDVFKMVEIHEQRRELLVVAASHGYGLYYPVVV